MDLKMKRLALLSPVLALLLSVTGCKPKVHEFWISEDKVTAYLAAVQVAQGQQGQCAEFVATERYGSNHRKSQQLGSCEMSQIQLREVG